MKQQLRQLLNRRKLKVRLGEIKWANALFLTLTPILTLIFVGNLVVTSQWTWGLTALLLISYTLSNMSITVAYHRYFAHRSYDISDPLRLLFLVVSAMAFQGSALQWATDHRRHHREVDSHEDPYTIQRGFFFAHWGWLFIKDRHPDAEKYPADLLKMKFVLWQHRFYYPLALTMGFAVPALLGALCGLGFWPSLIVGGLARVVLSQHSTFLINSAAHTFGVQPYTDKNSARDSFTMAVLTFGEGYHNYHHHFQIDYRNGVRWYHWDPSKWAIRAMAFLGLAQKLRRIPQHEILRAKIEMQEKLLVARGASRERVQALRERMLKAQELWQEKRREMLNDWESSSLNRRTSDTREAVNATLLNAQIALQERRVEFELAQVEFKQALQAWDTYVRLWLRLNPISQPVSQ